MNQEIYDLGYDAALEGKGAHDLPHDLVDVEGHVEAWYAGFHEGVREAFLLGAIRMLKNRGYTGERIARAMEQVGI